MFIARTRIERSSIQSLSRYSTETLQQRQVKVWWDAGCPLCQREINFLKQLDKDHRIEFEALDKSTPDEVAVEGEPCPRLKSELLARFHAKEGDGPIVSGAKAFAIMWRQVPQKQLRWLGERARNPSVLWMLERAYRSFLIVRPGLQRVARWLA